MMVKSFTETNQIRIKYKMLFCQKAFYHNSYIEMGDGEYFVVVRCNANYKNSLSLPHVFEGVNFRFYFE